VLSEVNMPTQPSETKANANLPRPLSAFSTNTPPLHPADTALLFIPDSELPPARRLLVLVPGLTTSTELANQVWSLASPKELAVLFVGAAWESNDQYAMRRLLATLAAATRDGRLQVETRLISGKDWLEAVRTLWQPGDLVVCHREQAITAWGFERLPLAEALATTLNAPVYVLSGFYPKPPSRVSLAGRWLRSIGPFLIIAGFFVVQVQIEQSFTNWLYYPLMILSVLVELALLAVWH
jgi:hypothetical protein